jgi:hypothetical protein
MINELEGLYQACRVLQSVNGVSEEEIRFVVEERGVRLI